MLSHDVSRIAQDPWRLLQNGIDVGSKGLDRMKDAGAIWIAACLIDNVWNFLFTSIATSCCASFIMGLAFKVQYVFFRLALAHTESPLQ